MLFSQIFVAATALFTFAAASPVVSSLETEVLRRSPVKRQASAIKASLLAAGDEAVKLQAIFEAATGTQADVDAIRAENDVLLASVANCQAVAEASPALSLIDALGLTNTILDLQDTLDEALDVVIAKKSIVDSIGLTQEVHDTLIIQKAAVDSLGVALIAKVPTLAKTIAQGIIDEVDASFDEAIAAYA